MVPSQNDDDEIEPYETDDSPVFTEENIAQLQEEDVGAEPYTSGPLSLWSMFMVLFLFL